MKLQQTLFALGLCIAGTIGAQTNQRDSIHIVIHEKQNGTMRVLDTIVPVSQQQSLFTWMETNGWNVPPPPPPPGAPPMEFEQVIIIGGDSGAAPQGGERHVMIMHGSCDSIPPLPPGSEVRMRTEGGDMTYMRMPPPPPPVPGSIVEVNVETKDTMIDGKQHTIIIKTERIILPEGVEAPPMPPAPPQGPTPPAPPAPPQRKQQMGTASKQELLVYPNPTNAIISVEFDVAAKEKTTLRVIDMNGKVVYSEEIIDDNGKAVHREINLEGKAKGSYTVEVKSAKKVVTESVILQ